MPGFLAGAKPNEVLLLDETAEKLFQRVTAGPSDANHTADDDAAMLTRLVNDLNRLFRQCHDDQFLPHDLGSKNHKYTHKHPYLQDSNPVLNRRCIFCAWPRSASVRISRFAS